MRITGGNLNFELSPFVTPISPIGEPLTFDVVFAILTEVFWCSYVTGEPG